MIEKLNHIANGLIDSFWNLFPKVIMALFVLGIGYLLARLIKFLVIKLVGYIGKWAGQRYKGINLNQSANFIGTAFFWLILLFASLLITDILGLSIITNWMEGILKYSPNVLASILIISVAVIFGRFVAEGISSVGKRMGLDYSNTLGKVAQYLILFTAIIIAIDQIGFEVTFLINIIDIILAALLFASALAFGLGARTSISNILAAFYVRKMYKLGDMIRIGEMEGRIIKIDATAVLMETEEGQLSIPAKEFNERVSCLIKKK